MIFYYPNIGRMVAFVRIKGAIDTTTRTEIETAGSYPDGRLRLRDVREGLKPQSELALAERLLKRMQTKSCSTSR